jgi:mono/diheme cytochrome c family protein
MNRSRNLVARVRRVTAVAMLVGLSGCRGQTSAEPPIVPVRNMHEMPRYDPQDRGAYYSDGRAMRAPVAGTVAREMETDPVVDSGVSDDGAFVLTIPEPVVERQGGLVALQERGRARFGIYCVPCHGGQGDGQGLVPNVSGVAGIRPPTFHQDSIRHMPDGQLFATITNGLRNMPAYRAQIPVDDRWAIVSYVRALQLAEISHPSPSTEGAQ